MMPSSSKIANTGIHCRTLTAARVTGMERDALRHQVAVRRNALPKLRLHRVQLQRAGCSRAAQAQNCVAGALTVACAAEMEQVALLGDGPTPEPFEGQTVQGPDDLANERGDRAGVPVKLAATSRDATRHPPMDLRLDLLASADDLFLE